MATLNFSTGQRAYPRVVEHVLKNGTARAPRGELTIDAGFTVIELESPVNALAVGTGREVSKNVAAAEAVQLIGGFSWPDLLTRAAPNTIEYMDNGGFHGAYGSRIRYQGANAASRLREDADTRRAVITLWDPWLDNQPGKHDYPCTVALQFEFDGADRLCMNVVMRSNDAWLGLPYDLFQFAQLQLSLARSLERPPGWYRHTALSMHLYERDRPAAERLHDPAYFTYQPDGVGRGGDSFTRIMRRARQLVGGVVSEEETTSERWYRDRFASYMG